MLLLTELAAKKSRSPRPPRHTPSIDAGVPWGEVLILIGVVAVIGLAAYLSYAAVKRRRFRFAQMARQLGLEYSIEDPFGLLEEPFALFQKGDGRGIENVLWGRWRDLEFRVFDFWYYEQSTDAQGHRTRSYSRFECAVVPVEAACSHLVIERENLFTRLADALSFHDIDFESEPFNRTFTIRSDDRKLAHDVIDQRMMEWLMANGRSCAFEVMGDRLLVATDRTSPTRLIELMGVAKGFVDHLPRVVFSLYPKSG